MSFRYFYLFTALFMSLFSANSLQAGSRHDASHAHKNAQQQIAHLSDDNFHSAISSGIYIVDFYADWCGPCKKLAPSFAELANERHSQLHFAKVNIDHADGVAREFKVKSIPTLIIFKDGVELARRVGGGNKAAIEGFIDSSIK